MRPIDRFKKRPKSFWASVRSLSQHIGYSKGNSIIVPSVEKMVMAFNELSLNSEKLHTNGRATALSLDLLDYFQQRAEALITIAEPNLMSAEQARDLYNEMRVKVRLK